MFIQSQKMFQQKGKALNEHQPKEQRITTDVIDFFH